MRLIGPGHHMKQMRVLFVAMTLLLIQQLCICALPVAAQEYGKIIWFVQITEPGGIETPITRIEPCKWYRVINTEPYEPCFVPPRSSWWHIFWPEGLYCISFHVDMSTDHDFHIDVVRPEPILVDPPVDVAKATWRLPVGGVWVSVDRFGLLAPYIGLASTIVVATAATAIYVKRVKRRKEKQ